MQANRPRLILLVATLVAVGSTTPALAQWVDTSAAAPAQPQSVDAANTLAEADPPQGEELPPTQPAQRPPNLQQLLQAASVQFDPRRETPLQYQTRMKALEQQFKAYETMREQARQDPPIKRLPPGVVLPGMSAYQAENPFSGDPNDKGFFNGITPEQAAAGLKMKLNNKIDHNRSPQWAKQPAPRAEYVNGVRHEGAEDSMGFIK